MIKCPINYMGNKYKLLEQLFNYFPDNIDTFVDVFGGSFTVGINTNANLIIYNEKNKQLYDLINTLLFNDYSYLNDKFMYYINKFNLEKGNKVSYLILRTYYNQLDDSDEDKSILLFLLVCYGFNYQIRFNKKGEFNIPCGNRDFSIDMKNHLINFNETAKSLNIQTFNKSFLDLDIPKNAFVYLDPPYLQTLATYNENNGWNVDMEKEMYRWIDVLDDRGIKFALSNTSYYHNRKNDILLDWAKKYNVINLNNSYTNNNRYGKDNSQYTQEVLITNY